MHHLHVGMAAKACRGRHRFPKGAAESLPERSAKASKISRPDCFASRTSYHERPTTPAEER